MISIQRWATTTIAVGFALISVTACGSREDADGSAAPASAPIAATAPAAAIESPEIRYSGETADGTSFTAQLGGEVTLPDNLPDNLPLYPNGVPYSAMQAADTALVTLDSEDQPAEIYDFYSRELPASGWTIQSELNLGAQRVVTAVDGKRKVVLQIEQTERGARVAIAVSPSG